MTCSHGLDREQLECTQCHKDSNMNAHTPGPWYVGLKPGPMIYGDKEHGTQVADMSFPMVPHAEHMANVFLIAAAPELLEALKQAAELIGAARRYFPKSIKDSDRFTLENTCATINSAIRKAAND